MYRLSLSDDHPEKKNDESYANNDGIDQFVVAGQPVGWYMSKLSFAESEYFLAISVRGHIILNMSSTIVSNAMRPRHIQTHLSIFPITMA